MADLLPILVFFRDEFVGKRKWLKEAEYADLVALCQFLPGPSSSQVGFALGIQRAGIWGGISAFIAFTLPSALLLFLFAIFSQTLTNNFGTGLIHGLKLVTTAVVAHAVVSMATSLCNTKVTATIAAIGLIIVTITSGPFGQVFAIAAAAFFGWLFLSNQQPNNDVKKSALVSPNAAWVAIGIFALLAIALPALNHFIPRDLTSLLNGLYKSGALVFGGGHVVLPLLEAEIVATGLVDRDTFLAGYGATQAVPGPIFSFASFLGASSTNFPQSLVNAPLAIVAIFLPGFLLVYAILPFWHRLRNSTKMRATFAGANAGVVGILAAALFDPIWQSTIYTTQDFAIAAVAFVLLVKWRLPPWLLVIAGGIVGVVLG